MLIASLRSRRQHTAWGERSGTPGLYIVLPNRSLRDKFGAWQQPRKVWHSIAAFGR